MEGLASCTCLCTMSRDCYVYVMLCASQSACTAVDVRDGGRVKFCSSHI